MLTGPLEPTNEPYAIAKIAGIKMAEAYRSQYGSDFISVMPTNLYGPGDNYHPEHSHVVAALIRRFHDAKVAGLADVVVWGTGTPRREFLYVDDLADACVYLMKTYSSAELVNIGIGEAIPAPSASIPRAPTARRASWLMLAGSRNWAGAPGPRWRTACGWPTAPISTSRNRRRSKAGPCCYSGACAPK